MINKNSITGIILSGGKSSRMGKDKAMMMFNGKPFIQHVIDAMKPLVNEMIIIGDPNKYSGFNLRCIDDIIPDSGPLAGIHTGLELSRTKYNLVLSCDVPLITTRILSNIIDQIDDENDVFQINSNGSSMPLIAIYSKHCKGVFKDLLLRRERRLLSALEHLKVKNIEIDHTQERIVTNINNPSILKKISNEDFN